MRVRLVIVAALVIVLTSCAEEQASTPTADPGPQSTSAVTVEVSEWKVVPASDSTAAGVVIFEVTNVGNEQHNFSVLKTDLAPLDLPRSSGGGADVSVEGIEIEGFLSTFGSDDTVTLSTELSPGSYVLICNLVDHYSKGMATGFEVN